MKYLTILLSAFVICLLSCADKKAGIADIKKVALDTLHYTTIQWMDSVVCFDTITLGEKANIIFRFKNTGEYPLLIAEVRPGCGCTVADYTQIPVEPGNEGIVNAMLNSEKIALGPVQKYLTVITANTKGRKEFELMFTGEVKKGK